MADEATVAAYGCWQRVVEGERAAIAAPLAAGDGGGSASSWLFWLAFSM